MTERSGFSATQGVKKVRKEIIKSNEEPNGVSPPSAKDKPRTSPQKSPTEAARKVRRSPADRRKIDKEVAKKEHDNQEIVPKENYSYQPIHDQRDEEKIEIPQNKVNNQDELDKDPKLFVDVNIGNDQMERIVIYEGDTAEALTEEFCRKHNLNDNMKSKLLDMLEVQIAAVLPKIEEDEDLDESEFENNN